MKLSRREFLKASGVGAGGIFLFTALNPDVALAKPAKVLPLKKRIGETTTICPYDGSGCGFIVATQNGKVVNIEGDPDHPINRGGGQGHPQLTSMASPGMPSVPLSSGMPLPRNGWGISLTAAGHR